jgi:hypothetical protein
MKTEDHARSSIFHPSAFASAETARSADYNSNQHNDDRNQSTYQSKDECGTPEIGRECFMPPLVDRRHPASDDHQREEIPGSLVEKALRTKISIITPKHRMMKPGL